MASANRTASQSAWLGDRPIDVVLIGGSAGVLDVLRVLLPRLPDRLSVPVVIVVHIPERSPALLPQVLQQCSPLPTKFAEDKEPMSGNCIYFAPPAYHLLLESHRCFALSADPPVLYSRPSIDVLFDSAAATLTPRVLAVLLTGASTDGACGLQAIAAAGGITIVQTPQSAEAAAMPVAALARFEPTYTLPPAGIAKLLASLSPTQNSQVDNNRDDTQSSSQ